MKSGLSGPASLTSFVHPPPSRWGMLFLSPNPARREPPPRSVPQKRTPSASPGSWHPQALRHRLFPPSGNSQKRMRSECHGLSTRCFIHRHYIQKCFQSVYLIDWISNVFYPYFFLLTPIQKVISFCLYAYLYVEIARNLVYDQNKLSKKYIMLSMTKTSWIKYSWSYIDHRQEVKCDMQLIYVMINI